MTVNDALQVGEKRKRFLSCKQYLRTGAWDPIHVTFHFRLPYFAQSIKTGKEQILGEERIIFSRPGFLMLLLNATEAYNSA